MLAGTGALALSVRRQVSDVGPLHAGEGCAHRFALNAPSRRAMTLRWPYPDTQSERRRLTMKRKAVSDAVLFVTLVAMAAVGPGSGTARDVLADTRIVPHPASTAAPLDAKFAPGVALQARGGKRAGVEASGGGSFSVGILANPAGLDPAVVWDTSSHLVTSQIYETLVNVEEGGSTPVPGLAESWSVSPDGLTWTFNVRGGVTFHDGSSFNAAAVAYNLDRWWDPAHPFHVGSFEYFSTLFEIGRASC